MIRETETNPYSNVHKLHVLPSSSALVCVSHGCLYRTVLVSQVMFFFMNPIEKWHARRRFPWKLLLQIFKIVVVTAQVSSLPLLIEICNTISKIFIEKEH
ncbi:Mucolipin-2 [Portunus trituberculatus]|uniref:Mucolipin-2 n=1 Tax=Portunus trituberculatus TaxID=210409 RepID=A0A5B7G5F5_PORTR|nr:Mucolipin-2 [Portunus trituberculatus]